MHQRYVFRFWNQTLYRAEEIELIGLHYDDAKSQAWRELADRMRDRAVRASWRLVSTEQAPLNLARQEVAS